MKVCDLSAVRYGLSAVFCAAEIDERCICYAGGYAGDDEHFYCS